MKQAFFSNAAKLALLAATTGTAVLGASAAQASSFVPSIDGRFDINEGYSQGFQLDLQLDDGKIINNGAQIYFHEDSDSNDLSLAFVISKDVVDNSYGANSIGWEGSKKGGHTFGELVGSDKATFNFVDPTSGGSLLDVVIDYIDETDGGYAAAIASESTEGGVLDFASSLEYNFNTFGNSGGLFGSNGLSPEANSQYEVTDGAYSDFVFDVAYELKIAGSIFGDQSSLAVATAFANVDSQSAAQDTGATLLALRNQETEIKAALKDKGLSKDEEKALDEDLKALKDQIKSLEKKDDKDLDSNYVVKSVHASPNKQGQNEIPIVSFTPIPMDEDTPQEIPEPASIMGLLLSAAAAVRMRKQDR